jgi:hypothetical protein
VRIDDRLTRKAGVEDHQAGPQLEELAQPVGAILSRGRLEARITQQLADQGTKAWVVIDDENL